MPQPGQATHPLLLGDAFCGGLSLSGINGSSTVSFLQLGQMVSIPSHMMPSDVAPAHFRKSISPLQIGQRFCRRGRQPSKAILRKVPATGFMHLPLSSNCGYATASSYIEAGDAAIALYVNRSLSAAPSSIYDWRFVYHKPKKACLSYPCFPV